MSNAKIISLIDHERLRAQEVSHAIERDLLQTQQDLLTNIVNVASEIAREQMALGDRIDALRADIDRLKQGGGVPSPDASKD